MKKLAITLFILFIVISLAITSLVYGQYLAGDKDISVNFYSGGVTYYMSPDSFNASVGNFVGVYLSTSSSNYNYNKIEVQIVGSNSGIVYDATSTSFTETFELNQTDTYKVTIIKQTPFYANLRVTGDIIVYNHTVPITRSTVTAKPTPNQSDSNQSNSTNILTPTPTPSVPEFSYLTILPILLTIPIALAIVRKRLQRNV